RAAAQRILARLSVQPVVRPGDHLAVARRVAAPVRGAVPRILRIRALVDPVGTSHGGREPRSGTHRTRDTPQAREGARGRPGSAIARAELDGAGLRRGARADGVGTVGG